MKYFYTYIFIIIGVVALPQSNPYDIDKYEFVDFSKNEILMWNCENEYNNIFKNINNLLLGNTGRVKILHIGDSHIQADYMSGRVRRHFYTYFPGTDESRGYVFPYDVAGTNNPSNYYTNVIGDWISYKNISQNRVVELGISGMAIVTETNNASLEFFQRSWDNYPVYYFDKIKIFHRFHPSSFSIDVETDANISNIQKNFKLGFTEFTFDTIISAIKLRFTQLDSSQTQFEYYGMSLESKYSGVSYSALGVNGADADDWLRCSLFGDHLKAIKPDFIIISLGTNDGYPKYFSEYKFAEQMDSLVKIVKRIAPGKPILLTTPGDNLRQSRYQNNNMIATRRAIFNVAQNNNCSVWDFFEIMGGIGSIQKWYSHGLSARDRLHFSKKGYEYQGDLFFAAFMKAYDRYLQSRYDNAN